MFGGKRRRATRAAIEATAPIVRLLVEFGSIPRGFWEDPYVLGYLNGTMATFAKMSSGFTLKGQALGLVMMDTYSAISEQDAGAIVDRAAQFGRDQNPDYRKGSEAAEKVIAAAFGSDVYDDDPDVISAKRVAPDLSSDLASLMNTIEPSSPDAQVAGVLAQRLFYDVVEKRLGADG